MYAWDNKKRYVKEDLPYLPKYWNGLTHYNLSLNLNKFILLPVDMSRNVNIRYFLTEDLFFFSIELFENKVC